MAVHRDKSPKPDLRPHVCDRCAARFKSKDGLRLHVQSIHQQKFRFTCHVCGKGYNGLWNFRGHLASHDKDIRETCDVCDAKFQFRTRLLQHKRQHHSKSPIIYECKMCKKIFSCQDSLTQHKKGMHDFQTFKCNKCGKMYRWRSSLFYHQQKGCNFMFISETETKSETETETDKNGTPKFEIW